MNKKVILKAFLFFILLLIIAGGSYAYYLFNMPHRDVQSMQADYKFSASSIVKEYLENPSLANEKYLDAEGESKVLEVSGLVSSITEDFNKQKVVLLKSVNDKAGVSCTFTSQTNASAEKLIIGEEVVLKGVIRSGASYDDDLGMYENVIMEKCNVISIK